MFEISELLDLLAVESIDNTWLFIEKTVLM